jgi:hypothetical protein
MIKALLEKPGSMLDNLSRAEQLGWIADPEAWGVARELRNRLVHEYVTNPAQFAADILTAGGFVPMFRNTYQNLLHLARDKLGIVADELRDYL